MVDVGRGVTKDRRTYIYIYISLTQFIPDYVGFAQAHPNYTQKERRGCHILGHIARDYSQSYSTSFIKQRNTIVSLALA